MTEQKKHNIWVVEDDHTFKSSLEDLIEMEDQFELVYSVNSIEKSIRRVCHQTCPGCNFGRYRASGNVWD